MHDLCAHTRYQSPTECVCVCVGIIQIASRTHVWYACTFSTTQIPNLKRRKTTNERNVRMYRMTDHTLQSTRRGKTGFDMINASKYRYICVSSSERTKGEKRRKKSISSSFVFLLSFLRINGKGAFATSTKFTFMIWLPLCHRQSYAKRIHHTNRFHWDNPIFVTMQRCARMI